MKIKLTSEESGIGILGFLGLIGVGLGIWVIVGVVWYFQSIDGTPLPLPAPAPGGFIPLRTPERCECGGACWMMP